MSVSVYRRSTQRPVAIGRVNATSRTSSSQAPISTFPSHPQGVRRLPPRVVPYGSDSWRGLALTEALGPMQKPTAVSGQLAARGRWAKRQVPGRTPTGGDQPRGLPPSFSFPPRPCGRRRLSSGERERDPRMEGSWPECCRVTGDVAGSQAGGYRPFPDGGEHSQWRLRAAMARRPCSPQVRTVFANMS